MLEMDLSIGKFEFEIQGTMDKYRIDPVTDEETELLETNVVASVYLHSMPLSFGVEYNDFIRYEDYDQLISDLQMCLEKPDFYKIMPSPGIQILSIPGKLPEGYPVDVEDSLGDEWADSIPLEDYTNEPSIVLILYLRDVNGYTASSIQICMDEDETRQLVDYLIESKEIVENTKIVY